VPGVDILSHKPALHAHLRFQAQRPCKRSCYSGTQPHSSEDRLCLRICAPLLSHSPPVSMVPHLVSSPSHPQNTLRHLVRLKIALLSSSYCGVVVGIWATASPRCQADDRTNSCILNSRVVRLARQMSHTLDASRSKDNQVRKFGARIAYSMSATGTFFWLDNNGNAGYDVGRIVRTTDRAE
jgi:hypothetical protein